jgi:hypothetical protein
MSIHGCRNIYLGVYHHTAAAAATTTTTTMFSYKELVIQEYCSEVTRGGIQTLKCVFTFSKYWLSRSVFLHVAICSLIERDQRFGGTC